MAKQPGDTVAEGDPLLEVSTDKVDTEVLSPFSGVITHIFVAEDETVDVGTALAVIGERSEEHMLTDLVPTEPIEPSVCETTPVVAPVPAVAMPPVPVAAASIPSLAVAIGHGYLSLLVRRAVKERGIDLSTIVGSGAGGRIRRVDLPTTTLFRQLRLANSVTASLTMTMELDVTGLDHSGTGAVPLLRRYTAAVTEGIHAVPSMNARIDSDGIVEAGPTEPRIRVGDPTDDVDFTLIAASADGYLSDTPRIISPRVTAVNFGAVRAVPRITLIDGGEAISIGRVLTATVSYDPRAVNSEDVLRFLAAVRASLVDRS